MAKRDNPLGLDYMSEQNIIELLDKVGKARHKVARARVGQLHLRFPELTGFEVKPLNNAKLIEKALERELHAIEAQLRDIEKDRD